MSLRLSYLRSALSLVAASSMVIATASYVPAQVGGPAIDPFEEGLGGDPGGGGVPGGAPPAAAPPQQEGKTAEEVVAEAQELFNSGDFGGALRIYNAVLAQVPNSGPLHLLKGRCLTELGENELALGAYTSAEQFMRASPAPSIEKGKIYYDMRDYKNAATEFSNAVSADPLNAESLLLRGKSQLKLAQLSLSAPSLLGPPNTGALVEQAIASFERVLELEPKSSEAYSQLARARAIMQQMDEAIEDANSALRLAPDDVQNSARIGIAYQSRGDTEKSKRFQKDLDKAVADYHHAIEAFTTFLDAKGDPNLDQTEFEEDPDLASPQAIYQYRIATYIALAGVTSSSGSKYYQQAIDDCNKLLEYKDANGQVIAAALLQRGICQRMLGDNQAAIESFNEVIKVAGPISDALIRRGIIYYHQNDLDSAMTDFEEASVQLSDPRDVRAKFWTGIIHARRGEYTDAVRLYNSALRTAPGYKPARSNRGLALMRIGRYRQAAEDFAALVRLDPKDHVSRSRRDQAYQLMRSEMASNRR